MIQTSEHERPPQREELIYNGIPITVTKRETMFCGFPVIEISLRGSRKQWYFKIIERGDFHSWGYIENIAGPKAAVKGETTALAAIGMMQLQMYANRMHKPLWYEFETENPRMVAWYNNGGKDVLTATDVFQTQKRIRVWRYFSPAV